MDLTTIDLTTIDLHRFNDGVLFESALKAMKKIRAMIEMGEFTKDTFEKVEVLNEGVSVHEVCRAGIGMNVIALSENLWGIKNQKRWYGVVPEATFNRAKKMRNLVSHHYGHAEKSVDWKDLWNYIESERDSLVGQLEVAVKEASTLYGISN